MFLSQGDSLFGLPATRLSTDLCSSSEYVGSDQGPPGRVRILKHGSRNIKRSDQFLRHQTLTPFSFILLAHVWRERGYFLSRSRCIMFILILMNFPPKLFSGSQRSCEIQPAHLQGRPSHRHPCFAKA